MSLLLHILETLVVDPRRTPGRRLIEDILKAKECIAAAPNAFEVALRS
jgi:hypothetical protein